MVLARISEGQRARLLADFAAADWSAHDISYALEHQPDGTPHRNTQRVRRPFSWTRHRLALWRGADGAPRPSRWEQLCQQVAAPPLRRTPLRRALAAAACLDESGGLPYGPAVDASAGLHAGRGDRS